MELRKSFNTKFSKETLKQVIHWIGNDKEKFDQLMQCFFDSNVNIAFRAGWTASDIMLKNPDMAKPYLVKLINALKRPLPDSVRRNILRTLQKVKTPENRMSLVYHHAMCSITNPKDAIAIRCYALTTAAQICKKFPELIPELQQAITLYMLPNATPAIKSRIKSILKELKGKQITSFLL
ncbi:MAG: hypothetical protein IPO27_17295 [Bacteroidetes bacterium]|nr:hypothetical protein [Bacteroidota bacterium]